MLSRQLCFSSVVPASHCPSAWRSSSTKCNKFSNSKVIDFISFLFMGMHKLKKYFIQNPTLLHSPILQLPLCSTCIMFQNQKMCCLYINSKLSQLSALQCDDLQKSCNLNFVRAYHVIRSMILLDSIG